MTKNFGSAVISVEIDQNLEGMTKDTKAFCCVFVDEPCLSHCYLHDLSHHFIKECMIFSILLGVIEVGDGDYFISSNKFLLSEGDEILTKTSKNRQAV